MDADKDSNFDSKRMQNSTTYKTGHDIIPLRKISRGCDSVLQNDTSASRTAPIILLLLPIWRPSIDLPDKVEEDLKGSLGLEYQVSDKCQHETVCNQITYLTYDGSLWIPREGSCLILATWIWRCLHVLSDILWNILCRISLLRGITVKRTTKFKAGKIHMRWGQKKCGYSSLHTSVPRVYQRSLLILRLLFHSSLLIFSLLKKNVLKILVRRQTPLRGFCIWTSFASWVSSPAPSCWSAERGRRKSAKQTPWGNWGKHAKAKSLIGRT